MTIRYFTVEEANEILPELEPLVGRLLDLRARVSLQSRAISGILADLHSDVGGAEASQLVAEFAEIESLAERIQSYGCILKNLESGLLDFLCERDGRYVYLCWRYGEPSILYYHELHTGFQGRKAI
ncbi:MAG: DUF2203 domain-containing protein [Candidatus Promineofilum sp.]|nr:DUF2203 domain-containing protein [Promineifilum sp.]MBP9657251.1 DUF2203 domain-containing protein [Promineifilum sp.]